MKTKPKSIFALAFLLAFTLFSCKKDKGPENVTDVDGNVYKTVKIGNQIWMAENLRVTHFNTGNTPADEIPLVENPEAWKILITPGYCWYDNTTNVADRKLNGALYNAYTVKSGNLAPKGWHVATDEDWIKLENYLIENGFNYDGSTSGDKIAKSLASTSEWSTNGAIGGPGTDMTANNRSGFNAYPTGIRWGDGDFLNKTSWTYWWSSTQTNGNNNDWYLRWGNFYLGDELGSSDPKEGYSVRCVKD